MVHEQFECVMIEMSYLALLALLWKEFEEINSVEERLKKPDNKEGKKLAKFSINSNEGKAGIFRNREIIFNFSIERLK